ncbi:hypothetical protein A3715_13160 [Oleiphilus sp. HI0009]|nr:hypothetical protein A3715_13160 [Oleiphilus sp. HI0009]KZY63526.1 hypothetical protein A3738_11740 [Oleiphilus sp. HI0066]KZY70554.1 hypothetical protein A3739_06520 [Oleiphilus sp. HI0067]KZZ62189.1 hypothetical protein A3762_13670 [Oleiphilus sp. HI0125]
MILKLLIKLVGTNQPQKKFQLECRLMFAFVGKFKFCRKFFQRRIYYKYHCEVSHEANVPASTQFVHPVGVIIGSQAMLEENVTVYQGVTIGANLRGDNSMPRIGRGSTLCAGAKLIGGINIGKGVIVGANSVVTKDVPDGSIVVGVNRIVGQNKA